MALAACGGALAMLAPYPASAQAVVQPLPSPAVGALDSALRRLAADPRNVQALVDAGYAALQLNDADAAIGFFSRASEIAPQNARAKAGLGSAFVRSENPYDAMLLFEEALRLGAPPASLAADRGLASDMVGDAQSAQTFYRQALTGGANDEISRRLALSLAVSGKRSDMEDVLLPLLKKNDLAAFRTRAFGLAILGDTKEASDIVDVIMPKEMAKRIKPYLKQLPRLTPAQQIAAATFGHFPPEKNIGSDDPRFARYGGANKPAAPQATMRTADAGLIPAGEPLGAKGKELPAAQPQKPMTRGERARAQRAEKARGQQLAVASQPARAASPAAAKPTAQTEPAARAKPTQELAPISPRPGFSSAPAPASKPAETLPPGFAQPTQTGSQPAALPPGFAQPTPVTGELPPRSGTASPAAASPTGSSSPSFDLGTLPQSRTGQPAGGTVAPGSVPSTNSAAVGGSMATAAPLAPSQQPAAPAAPGFASTAVPTAASVPATAPIYSPSTDPIASYATPPVAPPAGAQAPEQTFSSVADAFTGFDRPPPVTVLPGAVDLTTIKVAREAPPVPKPDPKPEVEKPAKETAREKAAREAKEKAAKEKAAKEKAKKAHPSRFWVQVGTGRDRSALAFTWRKMGKDDPALFKGRKPYVTPWGQTNRLVTGPFPSDGAAKDFLKKLKAANYDSFAFTSDEGQEVEVLGSSR